MEYIVCCLLTYFFTDVEVIGAKLHKFLCVFCRLNEDIMESLFGCNSGGSAKKEDGRNSVVPPTIKENRVLDPKKSQNIAILLKALNVTQEVVSEALLEGN